MTDVSALEAYTGQIAEAAAMSGAASKKQHEYIHGDDQTDVITESGPVPSIAKQARTSAENTAWLEGKLADPSDPSLGAGMLANGVITLGTVADMVAMSGWKEGQRIRTMGYRFPGDGGSNEYLIVPAGTGAVDGGQYINVPGAQAKGLFPGAKISVKQFNANGNASTDSQEVPIRAALNKIIPDSTDKA